MPVSQVHLQADENGRHYELTMEAVDGGHRVELIGSDADGQLLAAWSGTLPCDDVAVIARLLTAGVSALTGAPAKTASTLQERRSRHANAQQPWTADDDQRLAGLAAAPHASIPGLMKEFGRSRGAIRARLERLGVGAALLNRTPADRS